ncbi:Fe-S cluster assembly protein SufB [Candidatus Peregrinibacteria bacterium CG10_big_fil_rev_8_21_14_0_10_55_24]|nr:MAG: Fe-S cluster assembly protein SufB [Candidatus Peregrinibacteria bacterium CG10_big_fil_rev_8_21_14_0_10_55_24]
MPPSQTIFGSQREFLDEADPALYAQRCTRGLTRNLIEEISAAKDEPSWMRARRLDAYETYLHSQSPRFGPDLSRLDLTDILYFAQPGIGEAETWEALPKHIRRVYDRLGIPEAERRVLAGVGAQYESDVIYHRLKERWGEQGVLFLSMDDAVREYPDLVQEYFMRCIPATDHRFAALHGAVWSGGTFLYVPAGVTVTEPLQAYFRMNAPGMGQFEHTLIIVEEGANVHYIEGCSAPKYGRNGLHAGCVEIFAKPGSRVRYSSVENWSRDTYNLNTKRAIVEQDATMEWIGSNMGSGVTMLYPCSLLVGEGARCDHLGLAVATAGQWQDTGAKVLHLAPHTTSTVASKSVSMGGGVCTYRGLLHVAENAHGCTSRVECDALLLDETSRADTIPTIRIHNDDVTVAHEASVGKLSPEQVFYLTARGIGEEEAKAMIVNGFIEPIIKELPLEYALEMNRLITLEMEGSVG